MLQLPLKTYIIGVLVVLNIIAFSGWKCTNTDLVNEKVNHANTVKDFRIAQDEANLKAEQTRQKLLKEAQINAEQADARYASLLDEYRANLVRYQANQSSTGGTYYYQRPTPEGGYGPSTDTFIPAPLTLNISIVDAQICAVNTARLQSVQEWAVNLPQ